MTRVVTEPAEPESGLRHYMSTWLKYATNKQAVVFVVGEEWDAYAGSPGCPINYAITYAREFRYDGARQRYLNRELDPVALMSEQIVSVSETWSDYDGDSIYGDFTVDSGTVTNERSFEPGIARSGVPGDPLATEYYHADHLGTTRLLTNDESVSLGLSAYTAFGERVDGTMTAPLDRYGYAGAWGYQGHEDFPYLHVGARYYDPSSGRFLQRDPIGIRGALNVYAYADSAPTHFIDPTGFGSVTEKIIGVIKKASRVARKVAGKVVARTSRASGVGAAMIDTSARALQCAPDVVRLYVGVGHRNKSMRHATSADDFLERLERGRGKYIKPARW